MNIQQWTPLQQWLYAGACVLLPIVWGLAIVWVTNQVERLVARRRHPGPSAARPEPPTLEFHI